MEVQVYTHALVDNTLGQLHVVVEIVVAVRRVDPDSLTNRVCSRLLEDDCPS